MAKAIFIFFMLQASFFTSPVETSALDAELVISGANDWKEIVQSANIEKQPGKWGYRDLILKDAEYEPDESTDCLVHFNSAKPEDATGNYSAESKNPFYSQKDFMFGYGSAAFQSNENPVLLIPIKKGCLFSPGNIWDDFTFELWLSPVHLTENEVIFSWEGAMKQGETLVSQYIKSQVHKQRLSWEFGNFFTYPDMKKTVALTGIKELIPHAWHHHLVRFDSRTGLLEYLVDGIPEASTYVTDNGKESGRVSRPFTGDALPIAIKIGGNYTGYIDELRIKRSFVDKPVLKKYANIKGRAESTIFDLGGSGSLSKRAVVTDVRPGNSFVSYFIRSSDSPFSNDNSLDLPWIEIDPKKNFDPKVVGRFVQLAFTMYPDGSKTESPRVSRVTLVAESKLPPPAPIGLVAIPGNGKVTLKWKRVNFDDIKGYRIYYGEDPGNYDGKNATQGSSPIDAGSSTQFEVTGLSNGTLYFFAIVAYDSEEFPDVSNFSSESSVRPLGLYK